MFISSDLRINEGIRAREVRVVDEQGQQLGIMPLREGIRIAQERGLDLVEVAPNAKPVVCRIMDYGKHKYEQSKRDKAARKKQKVINVKEVRMSPKIDEHDFNVKTRSAEKFLKAGDKVKVTIRFRGREIVHTALAKEKLEEMAGKLKEFGVVERVPKLEGRNMIMVLVPKTDNAKTENKKADEN
ncbi:MAG: translation initiation factor IF-3 [Firmicutes bacterium]|jgi:translation initiation factor IF-3|nr:translation initiation factor IF-3 [Bacillota bacterium]